MFSNLKLSMKMGLGFGCILILLSIVLLVSISALQQADEGISQYRGLARNTNLTGQLQTSMLNVRMNVKDFMLTQDEQELQHYRDDLSSVKAFLDDAN
ncbi:TPA: MCP four helix bundle domain-containing protein, partial [Vibrio parahaemolyticus]